MEALNKTEAFQDIPVASIVLGLLIPILLYWFSTRNHNYWKKQGFPFDKPYPFIGSIHATFSNKSFEEIELERYKKHGRIYGFYEANNPMLSVAEPELLRNIFVKDFQYFPNRRNFVSNDPIADKMLTILRGEDWKRVRTIVSPTFSTGKIKRVMSIFQECAKTLIQNFKMIASQGEAADVVRTYGAFTMDVIASSAFSTKIDSHNDPENEFVRHAKSAFNQSFGIKLLFFIMFPGLSRKLGINVFSSKDMDFFKRVTLEIIAERKRTGQTRNDFLQLLIDTANEIEKEEKLEDGVENLLANYVDDSTNHPVFKNASSRKLSKDEVIAQCVIFFLAGYHTTATTLSLATYLLALNEDVQDKVFEEISDILSETNGELTYASIQKMKYLDNVISEVLRLYSPLIRLERTAEVDYKLGDTGITIPKGMLVGIPIFAMHRDPKLFPDPERFNPDRFNPEEKEKLIPYSYMPFGVGPRNCIARRFALLELKVCLVYVFSAFQAKKCPETKVPLDFGKGSGLLRPVSIKLKMIPRDNIPLKS